MLLMVFRLQVLGACPAWKPVKYQYIEVVPKALFCVYTDLHFKPVNCSSRVEGEYIVGNSWLCLHPTSCFVWAKSQIHKGFLLWMLMLCLAWVQCLPENGNQKKQIPLSLWILCPLPKFDTVSVKQQKAEYLLLVTCSSISGLGASGCLMK